MFMRGTKKFIVHEITNDFEKLPPKKRKRAFGFLQKL
jgi:hypothetical protein